MSLDRSARPRRPLTAWFCAALPVPADHQLTTLELQSAGVVLPPRMRHEVVDNRAQKKGGGGPGEDTLHLNTNDVKKSARWLLTCPHLCVHIQS